MSNWWDKTGNKIAWYFCTYGIPAIIAGVIYSEL